MVSIAVLGPVTTGDGGTRLPPRDRVVLSVLVARRGRTVPADTLVDALWGERPPVSAHKVVQGCIARLRRLLGAEAIRTEADGYRLSVAPEEIDTGRFERLVRRARELSDVGHHDQAAHAAQQALDLWRGQPFADLADWGPGRTEADRLDGLRLRAEELRLDALLSSGRHAEALPEAARAVEEEPLREHRWALLARAQYRDGGPADALDTLRRARQVLADELGLDPGPELVELEQLVLHQDPCLTASAAGHPSAGCPWPGLVSYDVEDADDYFGRDAELAECLERLDRTRFLAIVGPSGTGKSSLARAGLAARLAGQGRAVRVITPGTRPDSTTAVVTPEQGSDEVLVVDQCEEILAPAVAPLARQRFLDAVIAHRQQGGGEVVMTLRADRLGELAQHPALAELVEDGLYLLRPMDQAGVREMIEGPARRAGLLLEPGLVDLLVRDVEGEPGSLPLLGHALRQTWLRREGATLTVEGYRASGGIHVAVARSAEQVYEEATGPRRRRLRELLLRMVQPGPDGNPVRTSIPRDALTDAHDVELVEQLVRARLVTAGYDRFEIAHEALVRAWPRLQGWLVDDMAGERIRHHLATSAAAWDGMGRPASELYRGARLAAAREWRDSGVHQLRPVEQEFLAASSHAHRSRLARAEDEARHQRKVNRRLRLLVVGVSILALVAAAFGVLARQQWQASRAAQAGESAAADRARSHELAASAVALVGADPALAKALAVLAADAAPPSFQTRDALHRVVAADQIVARISMDHRPSDVMWAELHPDGDRVAMAAEAGLHPGLAVEVHDARSGGLLWEWVRPDTPGHESAFVAGATYSPDGEVLAGGVVWAPQASLRLGPRPEASPPPAEGLLGVHLWDGRTHEPLGVVDVGPCGGWPVAIAGDHLLVRTLAAPTGTDARDEAALLEECRWTDGAMGTVVVDRTTGESHLLTVVESLNLYLTVGHALSDDGTLAVVPDFATNEGVLVNTANGRELGRLEGAIGFDFDTAGERLLALDRSNPALYSWLVVTVPDLAQVSRFTGHDAMSLYGRFGPGDDTVVTTGLDNRLLHWDAGTGDLLRRLDAIGSGVPTSAGDVVLVPRLDTAGAVLVAASPPGELWSVPSCLGFTGSDRIRVTPDLVVAARDCDRRREGRLETFTRAGDQVASWAGVSWEALAVSPDGSRVVGRDGGGTTDDGTPVVGPLRVRDLRTGEVVGTLEGFCRHPIADGFTGIPDDPALQGGAGRWVTRPSASPQRWSGGPRTVGTSPRWTARRAGWACGRQGRGSWWRRSAARVRRGGPGRRPTTRSSRRTPTTCCSRRSAVTSWRWRPARGASPGPGCWTSGTTAGRGPSGTPPTARWSSSTPWARTRPTPRSCSWTRRRSPCGGSGPRWPRARSSPPRSPRTAHASPWPRRAGSSTSGTWRRVVSSTRPPPGSAAWPGRSGWTTRAWC